MKNAFSCIFCCAILFSGTQSVTADMVNYNYSLASDGTLTTPHSWAIVDTFDTDRPGWSYYGSAIVSGSVLDNYTAPYLDITKYLTINSPSVQSGSLAIVTFGGAVYNYLGLYWGSINTYNKIEFLKDGNISGACLGTDITLPIIADQSSDGYVNFYLSHDFDGIRFTSTAPAFEIDNLAVGIHAPIPGAVLLGIIGLSISGWLLKRKTQ